MKQKNIDKLKTVRCQLDEKSYTEDDWKFVNFIFDELENGRADIACHTPLHHDGIVGSFVEASDTIESKECYIKRHICYDIGKLLSWKTTKIKGKCGRYIGCYNERWDKRTGDNINKNVCHCDEDGIGGIPNDFFKYHVDTTYDGTEAIAVYPWSCIVGVRFDIPGEPQVHVLSKYFKTLGPHPFVWGKHVNFIE